MSVARFALLSYMCVYVVLGELVFFFWLDETPLRHRGIFGATSWHVAHVFHSMLFFFHFASFSRRGSVRPLRGLLRCRVCAFVLGFCGTD